jgi:uncharacterized protein YjiS (DUF1127 family)
VLTEQVALYEPCACSDTPLPITDHRAVAKNDAICDGARTLTQEIEAWPRRASAASGLGDVVDVARGVADVVHAFTSVAAYAGPYSRSSSYKLHQAARANRAAMVADLVVAAIRGCSSIVRSAYAAYRQRRNATALYEMLSRLDDHMLHDLGFDRSEVRSIASNASSEVDDVRMRAFWMARGL